MSFCVKDSYVSRIYASFRKTDHKFLIGMEGEGHAIMNFQFYLDSYCLQLL